MMIKTKHKSAAVTKKQYSDTGRAVTREREGQEGTEDECWQARRSINAPVSANNGPSLGLCLPAAATKERIKLLAIADSTQIAAATTNGASSGQQGKEGKHIGSRQ